jgi:hypothetical protein
MKIGSTNTLQSQKDIGQPNLALVDAIQHSNMRAFRKMKRSRKDPSKLPEQAFPFRTAYADSASLMKELDKIYDGRDQYSLEV